MTPSPHLSSGLDKAQAAHSFAALGAEPRLAVLRALVRAGPDEGLCVSDIEQRTGVKGSTLTHHLRALAGAGLVEQEKRGRSIYTRAAYHQLQALAAFILEECCQDVGGHAVGADKTETKETSHSLALTPAAQGDRG